MTAKFVAQKQTKSDKHLIVFQIFHKRKIWNYGTGISVFSNEWNTDDQRVRKNNKQSVILNGTLASYQNVFNHVYNSFGGSFAKAKMITPEAFKEAIDKEMVLAGLRNAPPPEKIAQKTFMEYCSDFLRVDNKGKQKADSTLAQYRATFAVLREYKPEALLAEIDKAYLLGLQEFLYAKNYELNSVSNTIVRIKAVLNWLATEGLLTNLNYLSFKIPKQETTQIALTIEEVDKLRKVALDDERYIIARDLFLFQSLVGIRYSDVQILKKEHFITKKKENYLSAYNVKTAKKIEVPLFESEAFEIAKKYDFNFKDIAFGLTSQDIYLKKIAEIAGLDKPEEVISYPQGKKTIDFKPKYELIGTHTARRTFITIASNAGLSSSEIGKITGQTVPTVEKYTKTNEDSDKSKETNMMKIFKKRKNK